MVECPFCNSDDPTSYFYYALPSILLPHVLNLFAIGLATSSSISGKEGGRWRLLATLAGTVISLAECWIILAYDWKANSRVHSQGEITHFYWIMRTARGIAIALMDAGLAALLWASSTIRIFVTPATYSERLEVVTRTLENSRGKMAAVGIVRNVTARDENLRKKGDVYWMKEKQVMGEIMDEREVVEGVRNALGRISVATIEEEARAYAENITGGHIAAATS